MWYVEFLRARRALGIYGLVLFGATVVAVIGRFYSKNSLHFVIPEIESIGLVSAFVTAVFSTTLATSLAHHVAGHLDIAWTKPSGRMGVLASVLAVDVVALVCVFPTTLVWTIGILAIYGGIVPVSVDSQSFARLAVELLSAISFYMLVQGVTSGQSRRAGAIAGLAWPVLLILQAAPSMGLPPLIARAIDVLDYLNPLRLFGFGFQSRGSAMPHIATFGWFSILDASVIVALGLAIAVLRWRRLEA